MKFWAQIRSWLRAILRRSRLEYDMDTELRFHLEAYAEDLVRSGVSRGEAWRRARLEFGGVEAMKEECREARGANIMENLIQDLRYGLRVLLKNPGFAIICVTTLALGIAVNATMFSMVSAFLLRRPPGRDVERVVVISSVNPAPSFLPDADPVSAPNYLDWRHANHVFEDVAASDPYRTTNLTGHGESEAVSSAAVSANYFRVLGVSPELGRTFADGEDQPGRDHVVILKHDLWTRRFGSDPTVIGRVIRLNREDYTVIGVMPATFRLLGFTPDQLWTPLLFTAVDQEPAARNDRSLYLFARLKGGVTLEQARAEIATFALRAQESFPESEKGRGAAVRTLGDFLIHSFGIRSALAILMTTVSFVLMIACANVAGLLLARGAGRRKELAIRTALGAGRVRVIRQLLTEGLVLAILGGGIGLLLAYWGIRVVAAGMNFNEAVGAVPLKLDANVLLFVTGISLVSALLCATGPALSASKTDVNANLKDEGRGSSSGKSQSRMRTIMVTGEIALAMFLLVGSGLLFRGISRIEQQDLGFRTDGLLTARVTLDSAHYKNPSQQTAFIRRVISQLGQIPGTQSAAAASDLPATAPGTVTFRIKGHSDLPTNQRPTALNCVVTPDFFETAGISLLRGRTFTEMDDSSSRHVVVVNQSFAQRHLKDQEPLGQQIHLDVSDAGAEWSEIVGVVVNVKTYSESPNYDPQVYEPLLQRPMASFALMLRTSSDPNAVAQDLRNAVAQIDSELPLTRVMSMPAVINAQRSGNPLFLSILGAFALLALALSAIGIYGLIAYSVGQRRHEIGIRVALGARQSQVMKLVLREGIWMISIGAVIGLLLALPLPKVFEAIFYDLRISEPRVYLIVSVAVAVVALMATYIPAKRATRVDPVIALRHE
jgi:predicted permease